MTHVQSGDDLYVVDAEGHLCGAITLAVVRDALADFADLELLVAADLAEPAEAISVDVSLWTATRHALGAESNSLPVAAPREGGRFVGARGTADARRAARKT